MSERKQWQKADQGQFDTRAATCNRRTVLKGSLSIGGVALAGGLKPSPSGLAQENQATPAADANGTIPGGPGVPDAYLRPLPPFSSVEGVPGRGGTVTVLQRLAGTTAPSLPREENRHWQQLEERLGVRWEPTFVPAPAYEERLAVDTAGGELTDLTTIYLDAAPAQNRAILQGAYADLTDYLTGDALAEYPNLARYPDRVWQNSRIGGRLYGVPRLLENGPPILFMRQNWATDAGIPQPRNAEEFLQLMKAFTQDDPDGNGQPDTWGLGGVTGTDFAYGFFAQVFRVPNGWRRNPDGSLTHAIETDEFRQTVAFLRQMFEAGIYHPDSATMSTSEVRDLQVGGRIGAYQGVYTGLPQPVIGQRDRLRQATPPGEAVGLVPFGHDGGEGVAYNTPGYAGHVMISAQAGQDPERVQELLRILDYFAAPPFSEEWNFLWYGIEGVHYDLESDGRHVRTEQAQTDGVLTFNNILYGSVPFYYPHRPEEARYIQELFGELVAIGIDNPTWGLTSLTAVEETVVLNQLRSERINAIVQGRESLDAIDQLISDWRSRGGDQIRQEYEETLAAQ